MTRITLLLIGLLSIFKANAGGDSEAVLVETFTRDWFGSYTLVVRGVAGEKEKSYSYFTHCDRFTVIGTYDALRWLMNFDITYLSHLDALNTIAAAQAEHRPLHLGWIGTGFKDIPEQPCSVASKALQAYDNGEYRGVISFHERY